MKQLITLMTIVALCNVGNAQNLVVNGSFETHSQCINNYSNLFANVSNWYNGRGTCDYFNSCANGLSNGPYGSNMGVPTNVVAQTPVYPYHGNAYAGIMCVFGNNPVNQELQNEFLRGNLLTPLVVGTTYYVSFKVARAVRNNPLPSDYVTSGIAVNKLGLLFTNVAYNAGPNGSSSTAAPIPNYAHVYTDSIVTNSSWTTISGAFVADSAYNYFLIGKLWNLNQTAMAYTNYYRAYYFIDDVCISADPMGCDVELVTKIDVVTACDSYTWIDGNTYTDNNNIATYIIDGGGAVGQDSIATLNLTISHSTSSSISHSICEGETFNLNGTLLSQSGVYYDTLQNTVLCDSVVMLTLNVNPVAIDSLFATINQGDVYDFNGQPLNASGVYTDTLTSVNGNGCDSLVVLTLIVEPTTGIDNVATNKEYKIYPNPTNGTIYFSATVNAKATNALGQIVADKKKINSLDLSGQPTGIYFITLTDDKGQVIQRSKIVKE